MSRLGKIPGSLGLTAASGKVVVLGNIGRTIIKETGEALAKLALKKAGKRLVSKLFLKSKAWQKAFLHVAQHFSFEALDAKAIHTVFVERLRSPAALERFVKETALKPTRKIISRMTIDGVPAGRPVVILEREFLEVIGETFVKKDGKIMKKTTEKLITEMRPVWENGQQVMKEVTRKVIEEDPPCKILRVIVDFTGRPITAYPTSKFL